ncbi:hypothetical protein CHS0354_034232 [Potamilus streckersoni]|uniref:Uncharacterized protein n=1 Tax=Potamilus streckersoni TaxID=2493646 RepID=A0AAE0SUB2_9BIVA|nr:hypothetical protein CHS0354_034232 [Potamilus streckersoni]
MKNLGNILSQKDYFRQRNPDACREKCKEQLDSSLMVQMRAARENGCSALRNETLIYKKHEIGFEMQTSASLVCKERIQQRVHASS